MGLGDYDEMEHERRENREIQLSEGPRPGEYTGEVTTEGGTDTEDLLDQIKASAE